MSCYEKLEEKSFKCSNEIITNEIINKSVTEKSSEIVVNDKDCECMVCFNRFKWYHSRAKCKLCNNTCHYTCYKKFTKRNVYYANKCLHCRTRTLHYIKPWWLCFYL